MPKTRIPKRVFQIIALCLLAIATAVWVRWLVRQTGPYLWLQEHLLFLGLRYSQVLGGLLAFLFVLGVWMIPTLILRQATELPSLRVTLSANDGKTLCVLFEESLDAQQRKQAAMLDAPEGSPVRRRFFRQMGWVGIGVGLGGALITGIIWYLDGQIWPMPLAIALVGIVGGLFSVITGLPIIYNWRKVHKIQTLTNRLVTLSVIVIVVILAMMCLLEVLR